MFKRVLFVIGCGAISLVIGSLSKAQQALVGFSSQPVGQRMAESTRNCGCSCTYKVSAPTSSTVA